ncbi:MAG: glycosyltransferase family 2 protein [Candidatus Didemnitutus sp.]|nr:glycosyltransferase family 2 protein [Candidatus Didemnitutus sp.]
MSETARQVLIVVYFLLVAGMAAFAFHKVKMLALYLRHKRPRASTATEASTVPDPQSADDTPLVCVQCPVYNEPLVVEALLESVARLRWPAERLEIQLLDDSTDDTSTRIAAWLDNHPDVALCFRHIRRGTRTGYKAGALALGMTLTKANYFAIFDADFRPAPDFLTTLMPHFGDAPDIGLVQARWEFSNREASLLTRFQGLFLDAHFVVEQAARHAAGLYFNFNGTAGIWRRAALEEAGGWTPDTVTEDLDVSYRAQLRGWRFVYRGDYGVPSELPENITAFKSQQRRWTKGGIQVMRKQLATILRAPDVAGRVKREAAWHLLVGFIHPLLIAFAALLVPYFVWAAAPGETSLIVGQPVLLVFTFWATIGLYLAARRLRGGSLREALLIFAASPLILSFGLAMSITNTLAVIEGLFQRGGEFVRTPKGGAKAVVGGLLGRLRSRGLFLGLTCVESAFGSVMLAGAVYFAALGHSLTALLLCCKATGFLGLAALSFRDLLPRVAR